MILLGIRLALAGGREAIARLALIAVAVAVGVGLLLTTLASLNAVNAQNARYAWLETAYTGSNAPAVTNGAEVEGDPLWWRLRADYFQGELIGRVDLAATGPDSPVPPGLTTLPGPGEIYASPALADLLENTPAAQLGDRYAGAVVGTIGPAGLPAPDSLIAVVGYSAADLSSQEGVDQVARISTTVPSSCSGECALGVGIDNDGLTLVLAVVIAALLFPVLMFIGGATRLSATRREQRFAAMRLVGATPRQVAVISAVESGLASIAGVALGFGLFYALRPVLAAIPFTGDPFFTSDLSLSLLDVVLVALGIPIGAAIAARLALRRVNVSPLGVTRRVTPRPPRAWRVVPLVAGVLELGYLAYFTDIGDSHRHSSATQATAYLVGVLSIMAGLVIAGPWLTMLGSRLLARRATRPATLIAARRLADNPKACFRAVAGLVLAVFVGTCALGIITTIVANNDGGPDDATAAGTVVHIRSRLSEGDGSTSVPAATMAALTAIPGVAGVAVVRMTPDDDPTDQFPPRWLVSCSELALVPALGHCPPGAETVEINPDFGGAIVDTSSMVDMIWPTADVSTEELQTLAVDIVVVGTDGTTAAVEQARTELELTYRPTFPPQTLSEIRATGERLLNGYRQLATVIIITSLPIAGCSLAVSIAGGLADRKRPFSLLRLTGAPLGVLRRVITIESAAPLLISAVVSVGAGLLAAYLFLHAQLDLALVPPSAEYYLIVVVGLLASLAVIASTLPLLERITGPEVARND